MGIQTYITPDGQKWDVNEAGMANFMAAHPNAKLVSSQGKAGIYDVGGKKFDVNEKGWEDFSKIHGQDAVRVGSLLEGKKINNLDKKNLTGDDGWDYFDDAEDEIVTNLQKDKLIKSLKIKVEGPDDDQRLDRSGRNDDVRLTNIWGKTVIINKSKSDYIKTLNAFLQKTSDATEHGKSDYYKDKAFKDWGIVTPRGGMYGTEQVLSYDDKERENEKRQNTSLKEWKKEKEDRKTTGTAFAEDTADVVSDAWGAIGDTIWGTISDTFSGKGITQQAINRAVEFAGPEIEREAALKKEYEEWQNRYSADLLPLNLKNVDGVTKNEYLKGKVNKEVYETYINNFDDLEESSQKELIFYSQEYNNKKTRAVLNESKGSIKRYFGINVPDEVAKGDFSKLTEEQLKDPKLKAFIDFKNNISDEDAKSFASYNNEVEASKKDLSAGGISRDIITTIFGDGASGVSRDNFLEWFENDSQMQGQSDMRFFKEWNPVLGEYEYTVKREVNPAMKKMLGIKGDFGVTNEYKSGVIGSYLSHKAGLLKRDQQLYENHGVNELIQDINGFQKQREALENEFLFKSKELKALQKQFENGSLEKSEKNINKYNKILKQAKAIQAKADNAHGLMQAKLTPENRELIDGYVALGDDITSLQSAKLRFLEKTSFGRDYAEKIEDQKATDEWYETSAWNTGGLASVVTEIVNLVPRTLGGIKDMINIAGGAIVTIGDSKEDKDFFKETQMLAREMPQSFLFEDGFGVISMQSAQPLTNPITGQLDYSQLLPQVTRTVGDMVVMIAGTKGLGALAKGAGTVVQKGLLTFGTGPKTLGTIGKGYKAVTSSRILAVPASLPVILPQNLDAAYAQISEDFSAADAYEYAVYASVMEAMVEVINPDINIAKRSLAKVRKGVNKGESIINAFKREKSAAFLESLAAVPMEILEEFIQMTQSGSINAAYNQAHLTDFQISDISEYKDTAILTALSVLTMRGLSGNLLHQNQSGLLRIASQYRDETITELNRRMKLDPNAKEYVSQEDGEALVEKLDVYQIIQSEVKDILYDEDGKWTATQSQVDALTGLVSMRHDLESQIEGATGKNLVKLKAELESVNLNIKNQRNTVKDTSTTHELNQANRAVEKTEEALKKERARKNKNKSNKKEKELIKELEKNEKDAKRLKARAPEYQVNNIVYKNREEFLAAINGHKMNGNLKKGMQLNIQVKNDYDAERLAYKVMNDYAPNSIAQKGGQAKVVMSVKLATQISDSLDGNKTDAQNKEDVNKELNEELLKPVKSQNKEKIQRLKDALKYIDLKQEGYAFGTKGFLAKPKMMDQVKLNNALLDRNIEAVSEATKAFGAKTRVLTTAQVIKEFGKDLGDWSLSTNGFFAEVRDKNGNVTGFQFIINKEVSDRNKANSIASHEMLHGLTYSLINGPRRPITDKNGEVRYVEMTKEGRKLIEGFLGLLTEDQVDILNIKLDKGQYRFGEYVNGVGVKGTELPFETYGEEYINMFHDAVVNDKTIPLEKNLNLLQRIAKFFTDIFKQKLPDATNIDIKTPEDLLKFLGSYNKQTVEGKFNDNIIELGKSSRAKFISDKAIDKKNTKYQAQRKKVEVKSQRTDIKGEVEFDTDDKRDLFSKTNEELSAALEAYGLNGEFDRENPQHVDLWNQIPQDEKLFIGYSIGVHWKKFMASKLDTSKQSQLFNYDLHRDDIIDVLTQGIETNNNGLPYIVRSWDPTKRALTSHIFGILPDRIPHVTQLKQFASLGVATGAIDPNAPIPGDVMPYSELTPGKVRKIKTLADVTLENKEIVSSIVRAEIEALIEQDPDNLEEQLTQIIEKEILKAVRTQMGPITQKVEGFVTEEYKQFLALNYENIIKGLDTPTIKNRYNQLFELVKTGTESKVTKKSDKPSLKKDSYFEKGIYSITTNKAKFTKYFIEGKYTTLIANQKGLAKIIAEGITEDIINNEIIENSENLNAITEAKLRDFANSLNRQKNEVQGNYNDQIKYNRVALSDVSFLLGEIADLGINKVFDIPTGVLLPKYKTRSLEAADFVWNDIFLAGLALDREDPKVIQKQFQKLFDAGKRGEAYERSIIDMVIVLEKQFGIDAIEAVLRKPTEKGGKPDAIIKLYNKTINIEAKMTNAQYSSVTFAVDKNTGEFIIKKDYSFNDEIMGKLSPRVKEGIELTREMLRKAVNPETGQTGYEWTDISTMPTWAYAMITGKYAKKVMFKGKLGTHFTHMSPTISIGLDVVSEIYNKKKGYPVNVIQMMGRGLFYMGGFNSTPNFLNLPAFKGEAMMTLRISSTTPSTAATQADAKNTINGSVFVNGKSGKRHQIKRPDRKNLSWRAFPNNPTLETLKSTQSIGNIDGLMRLLEGKEAQALKNVKDSEDAMTLNNAIRSSRTVSEPKGITVLDFDDTLATSKSLIRFTKPDGTKGTLNAEQYASTYEELTELGYEWDFSEFNKVVDGKIAPLFQKALKLQGKFGPENMFVLTARPAEAAPAIFTFLQANGLNIPLKNITGLANSTAEAKALWIADKVADGYNDFYFADDALQNVQAVANMLDQFDVKSKVQQAKIKFSRQMSGDFNDILEQTTGIQSKKQFSDAQAKIRGARTKYKGIIPASAQDFAGLLYNFLGKGKKGEADMAFFKKALIDPFARAIDELNTSRQSAANDYKNLQKQFPEVKKIINKKIEGLEFTNDQAARVYLWNKAGFEVPGLSKRDLNALTSVVENNADLKAYADNVGLISKKDAGYSAPGDFWLAENITSDLVSDGAIGDARADFLAEWQQNVDQIFSKENLNKIEATYGSKFREALEDVLYRMKTGRNRPAGGGRMMNMYMNWVNNSVGAIMFFNMRSAILQTISATNYINWSDNNPLKAAAAFANQPQYWKDFSMIFNSDYLKQRRSGNQRGINEAELSAAVAGAENKAKAAIAWLLKKGFLPTQIADSFAIASGGATFYRNRVKKYIKEGMTQVEAEKQAFLNFQETTEVSQQSARPDMISQQQASPLGRLILSFQNTPMQYARIMNKAARDLVNGRGDAKTHISKIAYYGVVQSIIFGALQSALFASLGEDDEEKFDKKKERILNGMIDSWLSGIGYGGKAVSTIKNTIATYLEQKDKGFMADHTYTILQLLGFSPPIGSKLRKIYSSIQTDKFNADVYKKRGFSLDNPIWAAIGNVVEGITNIPLGRLSNKMLNVDNALDSNNEFWQRSALLLGWSTWDLGIKDPDIEGIRDEIEAEKKAESSKKRKTDSSKNKEEKLKLKEIEGAKKQKQEKKDGKKVTCLVCKLVVVSGKKYCTIHEKKQQRKDNREVRCRKTKSNGKRCEKKTKNRSGLCYYHD